MSDPNLNPQHRRGNNWFPEQPEKPPPDDERQRRPHRQLEAAPIANTKARDKRNIDPRRVSRTAETPLGTQNKYRGDGRPKSTHRYKRRQAPSFKLVKIGRKLLHPRPQS